MLHLKIKVIAFSGPLTNTGEHRDAAVNHSDVMYHFHYNNSLTNSCASEHPHLTTPDKRHKKVKNLNTCLEYLSSSFLINKLRCESVYGPSFFCLYWPQLINRLTYDIY